MKHWTAQEDAYIVHNKSLGSRALGENLNRSKDAVTSRFVRLRKDNNGRLPDVASLIGHAGDPNAISVANVSAGPAAAPSIPMPQPTTTGQPGWIKAIKQTLDEVVVLTITEFIQAQQSFSVYDLTQRIRHKCNSGLIDVTDVGRLPGGRHEILRSDVRSILEEFSDRSPNALSVTFNGNYRLFTPKTNSISDALAPAKPTFSSDFLKELMKNTLVKDKFCIGLQSIAYAVAVNPHLLPPGVTIIDVKDRLDLSAEVDTEMLLGGPDGKAYFDTEEDAKDALRAIVYNAAVSTGYDMGAGAPNFSAMAAQLLADGIVKITKVEDEDDDTIVDFDDSIDNN